jgi:hypothetical protein
MNPGLSTLGKCSSLSCTLALLPKVPPLTYEGMMEITFQHEFGRGKPHSKHGKYLSPQFFFQQPTALPLPPESHLQLFLLIFG